MSTRYAIQLTDRERNIHYVYKETKTNLLWCSHAEGRDILLFDTKAEAVFFSQNQEELQKFLTDNELDLKIYELSERASSALADRL